MENIVIVGSGLSAFTTYLKLKKFNPKLLTAKNNNISNNNLYTRKNLRTNKLFSPKSSSAGSLKYNLKNNTKIHDRLSIGGNSNVWGGFININQLSQSFINQLKSLDIHFNKLDQNKNGYLSNNDDLRQLRDNDNKILNTSKFLPNHVVGFLNSFEIKIAI